MSVSEVERFSRDVKTSKDLQGELVKIGADADKIAAFAKKQGYDFTGADLTKAAESAKKQLTPEQLDSVAAGKNYLVHHVAMVID